MAMLDVKNLSISFGGLKAVDDFSITIEKGQLYGLIGPNGAGTSRMADGFCWMERTLPVTRQSRSIRQASREPSRISVCSRS